MGMSLWAESRSRGPLKLGYRSVARTKQPSISTEDRASWARCSATSGKPRGTDRSMRRPARMPPRPPDRRSTPTSEAGSPSLTQFLDLVEFYARALIATVRNPTRTFARKASQPFPALGPGTTWRPRRTDRPDAAEDAEEAAILGIDHAGIAVDDLEGSVEHYRRTLGVEPSHRCQRIRGSRRFSSRRGRPSSSCSGRSARTRRWAEFLATRPGRASRGLSRTTS